MMVRTWTNWNPIRKLLGTNSLKEGAVVAVGQQPPEREKKSNLQEGETSRAGTLRKEGTVIHR
jgi:hypothetical protein